MVDITQEDTSIRLPKSQLAQGIQSPRQAPKYTPAHQARQIATHMDMRLHPPTPPELILLTPILRHPAIRHTRHTRHPDTPPSHNLLGPATTHISLQAL